MLQDLLRNAVVNLFGPVANLGLHRVIEPEDHNFNTLVRVLKEESRPRKSAQGDKWNFCLNAAIIAVNRRNHEQTTPPEPLTGLQGEGGSGRHQGRAYHRPTGGAFRRPPQSDHDMEIAA